MLEVIGWAFSEAVVTGDRTAAERIDAQNLYGERVCGC